MNQTTNYQLSQWEASDRILMNDFNDDNAKIDAALKTQADAIATLETSVAAKADASALPQFVTGSYTGTGEVNITKHYSLGGRPKLVILRTENTNSSYISETGLIITEMGSISFNSWGEAFFKAAGQYAGLEDDGFFINHEDPADQGLNNTGVVQHYWAWI